ncbi:MAG: redox-sensing transcriptional repressor Rex [Terrimicrobiaceae bacterium]|nr:redox-sensing transcriptional repressor Rex [Terrimicrobiaceae bacterium]
MKESIPRKTVYRLSLYKRCLERLINGEGATVSSDVLAKVAGVKPTQLRKDLGTCGQFGKRGLGYDVVTLHRRLSDTLGRASLQPVILVGAGNLGSALLRYEEGFAREGFEIAAAFDAQPRKRSRDVKAPIFPLARMGRFVSEHGVKMAILCVPGTVAQEICNNLVASGIQAILNFAPIILQVPGKVMVNNVNLAIELENLSYFIR